LPDIAHASMHGGPAALGGDRAASRTSRRSCQSALKTRCYPQILLKTHIFKVRGLTRRQFDRIEAAGNIRHSVERKDTRRVENPD
ncbi:MAG: hypothetical protein K8S94_09260, partial [Planctomycetia bacterium]|nr:hypothetical protein [Planctomycetia bacterium]